MHHLCGARGVQRTCHSTIIQLQLPGLWTIRGQTRQERNVMEACQDSGKPSDWNEPTTLILLPQGMWTGRSSSSWSRIFVAAAAAAAAFLQGVLPKWYSYLDPPECVLYKRSTVRLHGKREDRNEQGWRKHLFRQWLLDFYNVLWFMRESNLAQLLSTLDLTIFF